MDLSPIRSPGLWPRAYEEASCRDTELSFAADVCEVPISWHDVADT